MSKAYTNAQTYQVKGWRRNTRRLGTSPVPAESPRGCGLGVCVHDKWKHAGTGPHPSVLTFADCNKPPAHATLPTVPQPRYKLRSCHRYHVEGAG